MKFLVPIAAVLCAVQAAPSLDAFKSFKGFNIDVKFEKPLSANVLKKIKEEIGKAGLKEYAIGTAPLAITEWTALGDSYAAGIGSDGPRDFLNDSMLCSRTKEAYPYQMQEKAKDWLGDAAHRRFNFGACSGAKMVDVRRLETRQKDNPKTKKDRPLPLFGKPQMSTMTVGGNDLGFENIVKACIFGVPGYRLMCKPLLEKAEKALQADKFALDMVETIVSVLKAGQTSGGAKPASNFELYINGYVPFWNETDKSCDDVTWSLLGHGTHGEKLTTAFRKRMNGLVHDLNHKIASIVHEFHSHGVWYVQGYQKSYQGHQFCDPRADKDLMKPVSANTWFWHPESAEVPTSGKQEPIGDLIWEALFPNTQERERIQKSSNMENATSIFKTAASLDTAIAKLVHHKEAKFRNIPAQLRRSFHPKSAGLAAQADLNIKAVRHWRLQQEWAKCQEGNDVKKADFHQALEALKKIGDNKEKNNCCTHKDKDACGNDLAKSGTAKFQLCGKKNQCVGCGQLANMLELRAPTCYRDTVKTVKSVVFSNMKDDLKLDASVTCQLNKA